MRPDFTVRDSSRLYFGATEELVCALLADQRVILVTDQEVDRLYADRLPELPRIVIAGGESHKTLQTVEMIHRQLIALGADRQTFLLAMGGGIVTDVAGFAASTFMRGIRFGFISTTLLGQVDASVGGKNGVNVDGYKNMCGTFTQPEFVIFDVALLQTLPDREFRAGLAEVVKAAVIDDPDLFGLLEKHSFEQLRREPILLQEVVRRAVGVKVRIVERDEREAGDRRLLNLGHTPAHAIEKCSSVMNHGEAVAVGLALMAQVAYEMGLLTGSDRNRIKQLLQQLGFVLEPPVSREELAQAASRDKKSAGEQIYLVLPCSIGACRVEKWPKAQLAELLMP